MKKIKFFILPGILLILILCTTIIYIYLENEIKYLKRETVNIQREIYNRKSRLNFVKKYIELKQKIPFKIKIFKNTLDAKTYLLVNLNKDIKKFNGVLIEYRFLEKGTFVDSNNFERKKIKFNFKTLNITLTTSFNNFKKFIEFLKLLENEKYLFLINKIKIIKEGLRFKAIIKADYEYQVE